MKGAGASFEHANSINYLFQNSFKISLNFHSWGDRSRSKKIIAIFSSGKRREKERRREVKRRSKRITRQGAILIRKISGKGKLNGHRLPRMALDGFRSRDFAPRHVRMNLHALNERRPSIVFHPFSDLISSRRIVISKMDE